MAVGLEIAIIKFVAAIALLAVSKFILEFCRYADNILYSFASREEYLEVKELLSMPNATITVGHLSGIDNPADGMTKFGSLETLREDVVTICANEEFKFLGLPAKFLLEDSKSESPAMYPPL